MAYGWSCLLTMTSYGQCGYLFLVSVLLDQSSTLKPLLTLSNSKRVLALNPTLGWCLQQMNLEVGKRFLIVHQLTRKKGRKAHTNQKTNKKHLLSWTVVYTCKISTQEADEIKASTYLSRSCLKNKNEQQNSQRTKELFISSSSAHSSSQCHNNRQDRSCATEWQDLEHPMKSLL